jgi:hypothetical protein
MAWAPSSQILLELMSIPRGSFGQNMLRMVFWCRRANDFGQHPEYPGSRVGETLLRAIEVVRTAEPGFEPNINWVQLAAASR